MYIILIFQSFSRFYNTNNLSNILSNLLYIIIGEKFSVYLQFTRNNVTVLFIPFFDFICLPYDHKTSKNVFKTFFVCHRCLKDVICTIWMSKRRLLYAMNVSKMSFVRYECLKDVICTIWMSKRCHLYAMDVSKTSFVRYVCLKDSFVRYGCLKDVFCTIWMFQRCHLYDIDV